MVKQQQQLQEVTSVPPKEKKNKKRQKSAAAAAAKKGGSSSAVGQSANTSKSTTKTKIQEPVGSSSNDTPRKRRRAFNKASQMNNDITEMYGEELPVPPTPRASRSTASLLSAKGKQKAVFNPSNITTTTNMEDGEVDEMDGLFFVDTAPAKLHRDVEPIEKPVISRRLGSTSPNIANAISLSRSTSPAPPLLIENKVVPDYVGSSSEIKEANIINDDGVMQGSSKDLSNAILGQNSHQNADNITNAESSKSKAQSLPDKYSTVQLDSPESILPFNTSPGGTKRKRREDDTSMPTEKKVSTGTKMLLEDLSSDESSSSEEDNEVHSNEKDAINDESHSDGESSGQDDNDKTDNLALNMVLDASGGRRPPPQTSHAHLAMEIDLTGSPAPPETSNPATSAPSGEIARNGIKSTDSGFQQGSATGSALYGAAVTDDAEIDLEGVEDDEYQADRSRYFKEDDPLKLCARCGETGHTVRDCVHLQVRTRRISTHVFSYAYTCRPNSSA